MHAQQQTRAFADGAFVVANAGAIGGADFAQDGAAFGHDVRDAEAVAYFDELAARDDGFTAFCKRVQDQKDRGGVVVHDDGRFRAGQFPEKLDVWVSRLPRSPVASSYSRFE